MNLENGGKYPPFPFIKVLNVKYYAIIQSFELSV